jgi:hypothetical protein
VCIFAEVFEEVLRRLCECHGGVLGQKERPIGTFSSLSCI